MTDIVNYNSNDEGPLSLAVEITNRTTCSPHMRGFVIELLVAMYSPKVTSHTRGVTKTKLHENVPT